MNGFICVGAARGRLKDDRRHDGGEGIPEKENHQGE